LIDSADFFWSSLPMLGMEVIHGKEAKPL
jgi:hypothetical protein